MTSQSNMKTILDVLDWSNSAKDMCAGNVRAAFKVPFGLGNAYEFVKYIDSKKPYIWYVAVFDRNSPAMKWPGKQWGHVGVVTEINGNTITVFDGPNAYTLKFQISDATGFISPEKMIALGGRIVIPKEEDGFYENIFNTSFPNGSTIYADLNTAESKLGDVA